MPRPNVCFMYLTCVLIAEVMGLNPDHACSLEQDTFTIITSLTVRVEIVNVFNWS